MGFVVIMMMLFLSCLAQAATFTVSPLGSDTANGSAATPWRTIQHAANQAVAGDTVTIMAGTYAERITFPNAGTVGAPITFVGTRGEDGAWQTVIDGSTLVTTAWEPAPEVGIGVFKTTLGYSPGAMTANNLDIWRIQDQYMASHPDPNIQSGFVNLARAPDAMVESYILIGDNPPQIPVPTPFWSGIEALFGVRNGVTYLRFRNREDPASMQVRAARPGAVVGINGKHFITLRHLKVQGGQWAVHVRGGAENATIDECYLTHGQYALLNEFSTNTRVTNSTLTLDNIGFVAFPGGDWTVATPERIANRHRYNMNKFLMGTTNTWDSRAVITDGARGTVLTGNRIFNSMAGITFYGTSSQTVITNNHILQHADNCVYANQDSVQASIHHNTISDCDHLMRLESTEGVMQLDIYANKFWQPWFSPTSGPKHLFISSRNTYPSSSNVRIYHNTFAGGGWAIDAGAGSFPFVHARNNLIAVNQGISSGGSSYGTNQNNLSNQAWPFSPMPTFVLPAGHPARNTAPSLVALGWPGMTAAYYGDGQPDYGALQNGNGGEEPPPPPPKPPVMYKMPDILFDPGEIKKMEEGDNPPPIPGTMLDLSSNEEGKMEILRFPLTVPTSPEIMKRKWRHARTGAYLSSRRVVAAALRTRKDVFRKRIREKHYGGAVLIDWSGSTHLGQADISALLEEAPMVTVAAYNGNGSYTGWLYILAENGKKVSAIPDRKGRGNDVDYQALVWLLKQPGPRVFLTDVRFCGGDPDKALGLFTRAKGVGEQFHAKDAPEAIAIMQMIREDKLRAGSTLSPATLKDYMRQRAGRTHAVR